MNTLNPAGLELRSPCVHECLKGPSPFINIDTGVTYFHVISWRLLLVMHDAVGQVLACVVPYTKPHDIV